MKSNFFILFFLLIVIKLNSQSRFENYRAYKSRFKITVNSDNMYGVVDSNQNIIIPFEYQSIDYLGKLKYFRVKKNDKYGIIDSQNRTLIPAQFKSIFWINANLFIVENQDLKYGIINDKNEIILDLVYDNYDDFYREDDFEYLKFVKNNKYHIVNKNGKIINQTGYDEIEYLKNGKFWVSDSSKNFIIDSLGQEISKKYSAILRPNFDKFVVFNSNDTSYHGHKCFRCISCSIINRYYSWSFYKNSKYSIIDSHFNEVLPFTYDFLEINENKMITTMKLINGKEKFGYLDSNFKVVIPNEYDSISKFNFDICVAKKNNKFFLLNIKGNKANKSYFDSIYVFQNYYIVMKNNKCGMIDSSVKLFIPMKYDYLGRIDDDLINASIDNCWGFIDKNQNVKIPFIYDDCDYFSNGLARVVLNNKIGFIDTLGKIIIPFIYDASGGYFNEKIKVKLREKIFYINKNNECIQDCD